MTAQRSFEHPLLTQVADFIDGVLDEQNRVAIEAHVEACRECHGKMRDAAASVALPPLAVPADAARLEPDLRQRLQAEPSEPAPGQLWRLRWDDTAALAVVLRIEDDDVTVAPVGLDYWMADDYAVVVGPEWSPLQVGFAVWVGLEAVVPLVVLDVCLGEVDVLDQIAVVRQAYHRGEAVTETVVVGPPVAGPTDERDQYRRQLALGLASLAEAEWLDVATPGAGAGSLAELLRGVDARRLAGALGFDAPSTFVLMSGERFVTPEEAVAIAGLVGCDAEEVRNATLAVPPELVRELSHPRQRPVIDRRAREAGQGEDEERRQALQDLLPVAARRAGDEAAPLDWCRLVSDYLDA
jgi:hypothetical protein